LSPKVSIITIVYNGEMLIERTITSVLSQTYKNIEYIIVDGASTDKTLEIVKKYGKDISFWISEPDKGLYDAMNKGLKLATGDYVWFLNAGDTIYETSTTENVFSKFSQSEIYYGETLIVDLNGDTIGKRRLQAPEKLTWKSFRNGMVVCHQSIIIDRRLTESYNLSIKVASDFDWVLKALKKAKTITNTRQYISRFLDGGINKQKIPQGLKERFYIMCQHYGVFTSIAYHIPIGIKFFWYWAKNKRF
jgi:glycosyltransferase involved in cell wall biosynthesis